MAKRVELFIPCFIDQLYPETAFNTVKLLERAGCMVEYNPHQTCCVQPVYNLALLDEARIVGKSFLTNFSEQNHTVTPIATCAGIISNGYNDLFSNSAE